MMVTSVSFVYIQSLIGILSVSILSIPVVSVQQSQNKTIGLPQGDNFSFVINVRGLTEYNEDKLAAVIISGDLIQSKIVNRSEAVLPIEESEEPFSREPKMVDVKIDFPTGTGIKAGDEFQACILSLGEQYQSVKCQFGVVNPPETGPQKIIIPL